MARYNRYVPLNLSSMNKKKDDVYTGVLSGRQLRDLESETGLVTYKYTKEDAEYLKRQRIMGVSSCFADGSFGNIAALGSDFNTGDSDNAQRVKEESAEFMKRKAIGEMNEHIEKKKRGII